MAATKKADTITTDSLAVRYRESIQRAEKTIKLALIYLQDGGTVTALQLLKDAQAELVTANDAKNELFHGPKRIARSARGKQTN